MKLRRLRTKRKKMNGGNTVTCRITSDHSPKELQKTEPKGVEPQLKPSHISAEHREELERALCEINQSFNNII